MARRSICKLLLVALCAAPVSNAAQKNAPWEGKLPAAATDRALWERLIATLDTAGLPYGALAAARRFSILFGDVAAKEIALRAIVRLIDRGYPFATRTVFASADLDPSGDYDFVNSYYLYKGIANADAGSPRWSQYYFERVDRENFPKFLFHEAISAYRAGELDRAEKTLARLLQKPTGLTPSLATKAARTLARLHFEREHFDKALDVYRDFLLKTNPVTPSDWLEAAWCLYRLKRYDEALGLLYNLEAPSAASYATAERYVLRALIYRDLCATDRMGALQKSFEHEFGDTLEGIKSGMPLTSLPALRLWTVAGNETFFELEALRRHLIAEEVYAPVLGGGLSAIATYLYRSERERLDGELAMAEEQSLPRAAEEVVNLHESIHFLAFEAERERFNPDVVFQPGTAAAPSLVVEDESGFRLRWRQHDGYWRDERLHFRADLPNRCSESKP